MASTKPANVKGTRDFGVYEMQRRNHIFNTIRMVFEKYGYNEIQTPAMELLTTLTGKYGDEGDKLIFKVLNSGDYLSKVPPAMLADAKAAEILPYISEKALRYDLTVPFARYVVLHQNDIAFPFKRFQIQPVWRADRPQRGRYREFYQCDADVVGSPSLINEAEFVLIYHEVFNQLGIDVTIKINNRKILAGFANIIGRPDALIDLTVSIDKLDKIGLDGVINELSGKGFTQPQLDLLMPVMQLNGSNETILGRLEQLFGNDETGTKGIAEVRRVIELTDALANESVNIKVDVTLARGLNYYTGCIFEVSANNVNMGSIGGGGRYDNLTGMFGLQGITGVGISFGADRIYDVMEELGLFKNETITGTKVLIAYFDAESLSHNLKILKHLRQQGISAELYPDEAKLKKQFSYANSRNIPFVLVAGPEEIKTNQVMLKNMQTGQQQQMSLPDAIDAYLI